jgi:pimeloyl-ACP methyl ester carboxylesterase
MPLAAVNDIQLYYESEGEGPAVVFLHGAGATTSRGGTRSPSLPTAIAS